MKHIEAMELALNALEESLDLVQEDYQNAKELYGKYPSRQARLLGMEDGLKKHEQAITTIKQALAAPVQQKPLFADIIAKHLGLAEELKAMDIAPVQEPVAVIGSDFQLLYCREDWAKGLKVGDTLCLCTPPAAQPAKQCPPCNHNCNQGDTCPARK